MGIGFQICKMKKNLEMFQNSMNCIPKVVKFMAILPQFFKKEKNTGFEFQGYD
jgi:hypothetical protein